MKPDAKPDVFERLSFAIDPQKAALAKFQQRTDAQQDAMISNVGSVWAPLLTGNPELAIKKADMLIAATENSPNVDQKSLQSLKAARQALGQSPELAQVSLATTLMSFGDKGRKFVTDTFEALKKPVEQRKAVSEADKSAQEALKLESEAKKASVEAEFARALQQAGIDEKTWNIKNLRSQISDRASRLKLDEQKVNAEIAEKLASAGAKLTELPESAQKLVNESAVAAATAKQSAQRFNTLAGELDKLPSSWGSLNSLEEWSRNQFGAQNFRSAIQAEYTRLANSAGIQAYKASGASGTMSDADLAVALDGIPKANANPATMASFMRGMAKMQDIDAALNGAKTDWLTQNRGQLGRSTKTFIAGDYSVKPGETYADFSSRVSADIAKRYGPKPSAVDLIPTAQPLMRPGTTAPQTAPVRNIRADADAILRGGQ